MSSNPKESESSYGSSGKSGGSDSVVTNAASNGGNGGNGSGSGNGGNGGNASEATMSSTSSQKCGPDSVTPFLTLLFPYAAQWMPVPGGLVQTQDGGNNLQTLGEWFWDPRLAEFKNVMVGFTKSDDRYPGYSVLETASGYALLMSNESLP
jgi:hypothetical protein